MAETTIVVTGLREVQRSLYSYSQQVGDRVVRGALRVGANRIKKAAQAYAPVKTGALKRRGIVVRNSKIHRGKSSKDLIGVYITIAAKKKTDPFYGKFQETGWKAGKRRVHGKGFIDRAFNQKKLEAVEVTRRSVLAASQVLARKVGL